MAELYHYGVKGMKWGVRRIRKQPSSKSNRKKQNDNDLVSHLAESAKKGAAFVKRNERTLVTLGTTAALSAAGLAYLSGPVMAAYNISSTELRNRFEQSR